MVINFNPKYIPGDIVYNNKKEIIRITSSYLKGTKLFYYRDGECGWIREDAIKPIPLTPEILEKNGWEIVSCRDGEEIYTRGGTCRFTRLININSFYLDGARYNTTGQWLIKYVHELQHHLWVLGINDNMEV